MGQFKSWGRAAAACAGALCIGSAEAAHGVLGQYEDLSATFNADTGALDIFAINAPGLQSSGFVREMDGAGLTAIFSPGFVAEPNPASFVASLTLTNIGEGSAEVSGQVEVTDVDGDTICMGVDRYTVYFGQGDANVIGLTWWVAVQSDEGLFDGSDGGQVPIVFPLDSALLTLFIVRDPRDGMGLFHSSFSDGHASTLFAVPAPAGTLVLGIGCVVLARRRRSAA